jgi:hypothetical protein
MFPIVFQMLGLRSKGLKSISTIIVTCQNTPVIQTIEIMIDSKKYLKYVAHALHTFERNGQ